MDEDLKLVADFVDILKKASIDNILEYVYSHDVILPAGRPKKHRLAVVTCFAVYHGRMDFVNEMPTRHPEILTSRYNPLLTAVDKWTHGEQYRHVISMVGNGYSSSHKSYGILERNELLDNKMTSPMALAIESKNDVLMQLLLRTYDNRVPLVHIAKLHDFNFSLDYFLALQSYSTWRLGPVDWGVLLALDGNEVLWGLQSAIHGGHLDVNERSTTGGTILHYSITHSQRELLQYVKSDCQFADQFACHDVNERLLELFKWDPSAWVADNNQMIPLDHLVLEPNFVDLNWLQFHRLIRTDELKSDQHYSHTFNACKRLLNRMRYEFRMEGMAGKVVKEETLFLVLQTFIRITKWCVAFKRYGNFCLELAVDICRLLLHYGVEQCDALPMLLYGYIINLPQKRFLGKIRKLVACFVAKRMVKTITPRFFKSLVNIIRWGTLDLLNHCLTLLSDSDYQQYRIDVPEILDELEIPFDPEYIPPQSRPGKVPFTSEFDIRPGRSKDIYC